MSLFEIKRKLYRKETDKDLANFKMGEFDFSEARKIKNDEQQESGDAWEKKESLIGNDQKKIIKFGAYVAGAIAVIVLLTVIVIKIKNSAFNEDNVKVSVVGPTQLESGKDGIFEISYQNENRATLKNAQLKMSFPATFRPEETGQFKKESDTSGFFQLGDIAGGAKGKLTLNGKAYDPRGMLIYLKAELAYTPAGFNSQFIAKDQLGITITSAPISLEITAPQYVSSGDSVDYLIDYKNIGGVNFSGLRIRMEYPDGYTFSQANPKVSESNNIWYLGDLAAGQSGKLVVSGKLQGDRDMIRTVRVAIGIVSGDGKFSPYNEEKTETRIVSSPLTIRQSVNGLTELTAKPGDNLRFNVVFKNEGSVGLRDVIITEKLDSPALDYTTLELPGGAYDSASKTITWKAGDFPQLKSLEAGQEGSIIFSIKVKDVIPVSMSNDKNFVISSLAKIDSPDIPTPIQMNKVISGNSIDIKLDSKLLIDVKGFYFDPVIGNSGPIPPKVAQATTYTIHWFVGSVANDVSGAVAKAILPTGVVMTGKTFPEDARLTYSQRDNTVIWDIGGITAGTGVIVSPKEVAFQVQVTPAPNQINLLADLVGPTTISAKDNFTGNDLSAVSAKKNTFLNEDVKLTGDAFKIQP